MLEQIGEYVPMAARLVGQVRDVLRFHHYDYYTEKSCVSWFSQYIRFR